jgi:hypothetical protein
MLNKETTLTPIVHEGYDCYQTSTGAIGMSKATLATICSVDKMAIEYILKHCRNKSFAPWLTPFVTEDKILTYKQNDRGRPTAILNWKLCSAIIEYYRNKNTELAKESEMTPITYNGYSCYQTSDGVIGMDRKNLANVCGISTSTIDHYVAKRNSSEKAIPLWLAPFKGCNVILAQKSCIGCSVKIIFKWDFCCAIIKYFESRNLKECEANLD